VRCVVCFLTSLSFNRFLTKGVAVDADERWFQKNTTYEYLIQPESGFRTISLKRTDGGKDVGWIHVEISSEFTERMSSHIY